MISLTTPDSKADVNDDDNSSAKERMHHVMLSLINNRNHSWTVYKFIFPLGELSSVISRITTHKVVIFLYLNECLLSVTCTFKQNGNVEYEIYALKK